MIERIKSALYNRALRLAASTVRECERRRSRRLINSDLSILSNNCCGGFIYQDLKLSYNTPTAGVEVHPIDFCRLAANPEHYLLIDVRDLIDSSFCRREPFKKRPRKWIAQLDDFDVYFTHYPDGEVACEKWNRRRKRFNKEMAVALLVENPFFDEKTVGLYLEAYNLRRISTMKFLLLMRDGRLLEATDNGYKEIARSRFKHKEWEWRHDFLTICFNWSNILSHIFSECKA